MVRSLAALGERADITIIDGKECIAKAICAGVDGVGDNREIDLRVAVIGLIPIQFAIVDVPCLGEIVDLLLLVDIGFLDLVEQLGQLLANIFVVGIVLTDAGLGLGFRRLIPSGRT